MARKITLSDGDPTDFDETRRLLYMALLASRTKKYNLAGTLVNALRHHHGVNDLSAAQVEEHILNVLEGGDGEPASRAWLLKQVDRITTELGD
jgi:hypothetical protein